MQQSVHNVHMTVLQQSAIQWNCIFRG